MTTNGNKRIMPEKRYTIIQVARLLGVHRCTIYSYMKRWEKLLLPERSENGAHTVILGKNIILFQQTYKLSKGCRLKDR